MQTALDGMHLSFDKDQMPYTLSVHGGKDDIFPVKAIKELDKQLGEKHTLRLYEEEGHVCLNKINQYMFEIVSWTKSIL